MVSERTRVAARGRGCRGARAGRAPRRRARGSAARDAPSDARDSAPISSARWAGSGVRVSGRARGGEVGCRNARARAARAPFPASGARGNAPRARSRDPHRGARAGVAEAHLVSRRPRGGALLERAHAERGARGPGRHRARRSRSRPPVSAVSRTPARSRLRQTCRRARIEPPRAPPACPARSAASPAIERDRRGRAREPPRGARRGVRRPGATVCGRFLHFRRRYRADLLDRARGMDRADSDQSDGDAWRFQVSN